MEGAKGFELEVLSRHRPFAMRCVSPFAPPIDRARERVLLRLRATFSISCSRLAGGAGRSICAIARFCFLLLAPAAVDARKSRGSRLTISKSANRSPSTLKRRMARSFPSSRSGCGARRPRRPTRARTCSSSAGPSKLCAPGSPSQRSTPVRCFGGSTNGEMSAPPRSIRRASMR